MLNKISDRILSKYEKQGLAADVIQSVIFIIAFIFFFPPRMITVKETYIKIDFYFKLLMCAYVYIISLCYLIRNRILPIIIVSINLFCGYLFLSTLINHGDLKMALWTEWIIISAMVLLIWNSMERNPVWCLKTLWLIYYGAVLINLYYVFQYAQVGKRSLPMEEIFFFGNFNVFIQWFLPAQIIAYVIYRNTGKLMAKILYLVVCVLNWGVIYYLKSSTSLVALTLFDIYMLLLNRKETAKIFNIVIYTIVNSIFFISIVVVRIQNRAIEFLVTGLRSNMTFSGRTPIWDKALTSIKNHLILGVGIKPFDMKKAELGGFNHSHNLGLEILYTGGLIAIMLFALVVVVVMIKIVKAQDINYKFIGCFSAFIGCYFLSAQFESHSTMVSVICLSIVYFILDAFERKRLCDSIE